MANRGCEQTSTQQSEQTNQTTNEETDTQTDMQADKQSHIDRKQKLVTNEKSSVFGSKTRTAAMGSDLLG